MFILQRQQQTLRKGVRSLIQFWMSSSIVSYDMVNKKHKHHPKTASENVTTLFKI